MANMKIASAMKEFPFLRDVEAEVGNLGAVRVRRCSLEELSMVKDLPNKSSEYLTFRVFDIGTLPSSKTDDGFLVLVVSNKPLGDEFVMNQTLIIKYDKEITKMAIVNELLKGRHLFEVKHTIKVDGKAVILDLGVMIGVGPSSAMRIVSFIPCHTIQANGKTLWVETVSFSQDVGDVSLVFADDEQGVYTFGPISLCPNEVGYKIKEGADKEVVDFFNSGRDKMNIYLLKWDNETTFGLEGKVLSIESAELPNGVALTMDPWSCLVFETDVEIDHEGTLELGLDPKNLHDEYEFNAPAESGCFQQILEPSGFACRSEKGSVYVGFHNNIDKVIKRYGKRLVVQGI